MNMMKYQNNHGQEVGLDELWGSIEEHCVSLEGAALILQKQLLCSDLHQVQKTICFVLEGLAHTGNTLRNKCQPAGYTAALQGDQVIAVRTEGEEAE